MKEWNKKNYFRKMAKGATISTGMTIPVNTADLKKRKKRNMKTTQQKSNRKLGIIT